MDLPRLSEPVSMIRSMTGYGQASVELPQARVTVALRAVNHRYSDVRLRLPGALVAREAELRRKILARVKRGRVEVSIDLEPVAGNEPRSQFNRPLLAEILASAKILRDEFQIPGGLDLQTLLGVPGIFKPLAADELWEEPLFGALDEALQDALDALDQERCREGAHLGEEMRQRLSAMESLAAEIELRAAEEPARLRDRLLERIAALGGDPELDPARVAQEAALLADRCDVTEEVVRLRGHLEQAGSLLEKPDGEPLGKRLDFLLQEMNRESNTINSKSAKLELSRCALGLKAEIEKLREQAQNVE
jgi:uncharacterized protein (TIGR00255 family)